MDKLTHPRTYDNILHVQNTYPSKVQPEKIEKRATFLCQTLLVHDNMLVYVEEKMTLFDRFSVLSAKKLKISSIRLFY